ncbi:MAG: exodeoxyribonuclease VII small subunit [Clostridia bacterium]|nr:exodeoxyribonuclease VII small subunit [Clostridia bacterium]
MKNYTFEEGLDTLEVLVNKLEKGELSLEASFSAFEEAMTLKKALEAMLDAGDKRIRILTEQGERSFEEVEE